MKSKDSWEEVKERIRDAADPVQLIGEHLSLHRQGNRFLALCPFHSEKTPSFTVSDKGFHCFGCGESGDIFAFLMKYQNLSFPEVIESLAQRYQIPLPESNQSQATRQQQQVRQHLQAINQAAAELYHQYLVNNPAAALARQYLHQRGVPADFIARYQLGYAPDQWDFLSSKLTAKFGAAALAQAGLIVPRSSGTGFYDRFRDRILFPIQDGSGKNVAFGGRILGEGQPKYLNSPESPVFTKSRLLFGLWQHREAIRKQRQALVVEGNFDLLLLAVHGFDNVVAPLGTALTKEHLRSLRSYCQEIVLLFDGDAAGLRAAQRSIPLFLSEQIECKVVLLPKGQDPDSFVRQEGAAALQALIAAALPLPNFVFQALAEEHGLGLTGKHRIAHELAEIIEQSPSPRQRELMASHWAKELGVEVKYFFAASPQPAKEPEFIPPPPPVAADALAQQSLAPKERQLLHFLLFYPEYITKLFHEGLAEYASLCSPATRKIIAALKQVAPEETAIHEHLLKRLAGTWEGAYVTDLLLHSAEESPNEANGERLYQDLVAWLHRSCQRHSGVELQRQLQQAQEAGDGELLVRLTQKILQIRKKK